MNESMIPMITAITALIVAITTLIGGIAAAVVLIRGQGRVTEKVDTLTTNIDGRMTELKESIAGRSLAEGQLKGAKAEQERTAGEPAKATDGKDVHEKMDGITSSIEDIKNTAAAVAEDLARSHERADAQAGGESGAAADAAARLTGKEKELLNDKE